MGKALAISFLVTLAGPAVAWAVPCVTPADIDGFATFEVESSSEHFVVHVRSGSDPVGEGGDALLDDLEYALASYTDRGFLGPDHIDEAEMLVFVDDLPGAVGGYSRTVDCDAAPNGTVDYIVVDRSWVEDPERRPTLAAHELFHAVQRAYAWDEVVQGFTGSANPWFLEASAVYEETWVFPERRQLMEERAARWAASPWLGLRETNGAHEYDSFLFLLTAEASREGPDWHRQLWESVVGRTGWDAVADMGAASGEGTRALVLDSFLRAAEMEFPRVGDLGGLRELDSAGGALPNHDAVLFRDLPAEGARGSQAEDAPRSFGAGYVWFEGGADAEGKALVVDVLLDSYSPGGGERPAWAFALVAVRAGLLAERYLVEDVSTLETRVEVEGLAEVDGVWLVVTPLTDFDGLGPRWAWSARSVPSGGDSLSFSHEPLAGCACSSVATGPPRVALLLLLVLLLVFRRRWPDRCAST